MNFRTSRRNAIDLAEPNPVSPSHTIIQVSDGGNRKKRRPRKRLEDDRVAVVDSGSPPSDDGDQGSSDRGVPDSRVTGAAVWAVTKTSSKNGVTGEMDDSRSTQAPVRRQRPRTAWSDDVVTLTTAEEEVEESPTRQGAKELNQSIFENSAFCPASDDSDGEEPSVADMLEQLRRRIEASESRMAGLRDLRAAVERDAVEIRQELNGRVSELETVLRRCVELAVADLYQRSTDYADQVDASLRATETNLLGMRKIVKKYSRLPADNQHTDMLKKLLGRVQKQANKVSTPPEWKTPLKEPVSSSEEQMEILRRCLGLPDIDTSGGGSTVRSTGAAAPDASPTSLPAAFLMEPRLIHTISCRHKKDKRSCGITDVALTDDGRVFVVDSHNKAVKIYDSIHNGGKLVHVLGRDVAGRPTRISYAPSTDSVIVSDDQTRRLRRFNAVEPWTDQGAVSLPGTSAPGGGGGSRRLLQFPSGHCVAPDGRTCVIDFDSKSIVVWNSEDDTQPAVTIQTGLQRPGNVAITRGGCLAVTDCKANVLKIFDIATGRETSSFPISPPTTKADSPGSSSDEERPLLEPHGVCADDHGLVFVADRRDHSLRVFDEQCGAHAGTSRPGSGNSDRSGSDGIGGGGGGSRSLASYDSERNKVGIPFAVACNRRGQLAIAEYVGTVRVYSYLADIDSDC